MERCPTCQARLRQDTVCPRCKTDLSGLLAIESDAAIWLRRSVALLAAGDEAQALQAVENSLLLKRDPFASLLQGFLLRPVPLVEEQAVQLSEELLEPVVEEEPPEQAAEELLEHLVEEEPPEQATVERREPAVEETLEPINAPAPLAEEALRSEAPATDSVAQLDLTIRKAIAWAKKVWRKLYPPLAGPEVPPSD